MKSIDGYKTYIVAVLTVLLAGALSLGWITRDQAEAMGLVLAALGLGAVRDAIRKGEFRSVLLFLCLSLPLSAQTIDPEWASYRISVPGAAGSATGIAPDLAVTNAHVVERQGTPCTLKHPLSGREWKGQAVLLDPSADVALVQVTGELDWVQLGDDPKKDQPVRHFGYGGSGTLREGRGHYIGAKAFQSRGVPVWHAWTQSVSGDSGGGLFDLQGRLCSVNWGSSPSEGEISLSTPASYVRNLLTQYRSGPRQPIAQPQQPGRRGAPPPKSPVVLGPRRGLNPLEGFDADKFLAILSQRWPR